MAQPVAWSFEGPNGHATRLVFSGKDVKTGEPNSYTVTLDTASAHDFATQFAADTWRVICRTASSQKEQQHQDGELSLPPSEPAGAAAKVDH